MGINEKMFKEYYVGRRGFYHNKKVVILSSYYDNIDYQDFGFNFDNFVVTVFFEDGSKSITSIKGKQIKRNLDLYEEN